MMANTDLSKKAHTNKMESVSSFIRDTNLPKEYLKEALAFFRKQDVKGYNQHGLLMEMPYHLRRKILYHHYKHIIYKVPLFDVDGDGGLDDHVFVTELCSRLKQVTYGSGQLIYQQGEIGRHMYILAAGRVEILDKQHELVLTVLEPGAYFGEGCILGDVRRRENMRAQGTVEVCRLDANDIDVLLDTYPHLHHALHDAYFKRKELFKRFETARVENAELTLEMFLEQMPAAAPGYKASEGGGGEGGGGGDESSGGGGGDDVVAVDGRSASGENGTAAGAEAAAGATGTRDADGGDSSEDDGGALPTLAEDGSVVLDPPTSPGPPVTPGPLKKSASSFTSSTSTPSLGSQRRSTVDPTLNIELPSLQGSSGNLGRGSSGKLAQGGTKKLEMQLNLMAEKHVKLESKIEEMADAMKRMEALLIASAKK